MDAFLERLELVLEPLRDDVEPEVQEVEEQLVEIKALRPPDLLVDIRGCEAGQVDDWAPLGQRVLVALRHHHLLISAAL
jgi:hypothetical protein